MDALIEARLAVIREWQPPSGVTVECQGVGRRIDVLFFRGGRLLGTLSADLVEDSPVRPELMGQWLAGCLSALILHDAGQTFEAGIAAVARCYDDCCNPIRSQPRDWSYRA